MCVLIDKVEGVGFSEYQWGKVNQAQKDWGADQTASRVFDGMDLSYTHISTHK